ncbi:MAG: hypothetical protein A2Z14_13320 [Chloroflexi bacterium RBG_16_48_8]|nr:MAG: hypothetical protein A2Z14_13320 [Chloroflexi bacterium RBG_16_48_8]
MVVEGIHLARVYKERALRATGSRARAHSKKMVLVAKFIWKFMACDGLMRHRAGIPTTPSIKPPHR